MNNEIKAGDKVRVSQDAPEVYVRGMEYCFGDCVTAKVLEIKNGNALIKPGESPFANVVIPTKYLIKVEKKKEKPRPKSVMTDDFKARLKEQITGYADGVYWSAYTAVLAKEIAVAYAEKGRYEPSEIGEKAVIAAKSVVDRLKTNKL